MSGSGAPARMTTDGTGLSVAVVAAQWHEDLTTALLKGAQRALADCRVADVAVVRVPGTVELAVGARVMAARGYDAVVCLGIVIRGGTPHFDYVCASATQGLTSVAVDTAVPLGFGVLTCDTAEQARDRCGLPGSHEDKGYEAAVAAVATAVALREAPSPRQRPG